MNSPAPLVVPRATAAKRPWALSWARRYTRWKLSRVLDGVRVNGLEAARAWAARGPLILAANHVCFWDSLVLMRLDEALGTDGYVLMARHNLERLPFMRAFGAVPLEVRDHDGASRDLESAASLVHGAGRALWIFPGGRQQPHHIRPLGFKRGVERLALRTGAQVLPVAFAYHFADAPQPQARIDFGAPLAQDGGPLLPRLEAQVDALLTQQDRDFMARATVERLLCPSRGADLEHGLGARLLAGRRAP